MLKFYQLLWLFGLAILAAAHVGCSKEPASAPPVVVEEEVVEEVDVPTLTTDADVTEAMAALSDADRAAAMAQKVCPVSDEPLGVMGTPIKVTVKSRDVFLCCDGCREKLEANPDKYLAKLDSKAR
jgi:hypothetical protein